MEVGSAALIRNMCVHITYSKNRYFNALSVNAEPVIYSTRNPSLHHREREPSAKPAAGG